MYYRKFKDLEISALAFGAMRFPVIEGNDAQIDIEKSQALVDEAMRAGINYYDTAWGYHGGNSETVLGKALGKYPRESFFLADKFPGYDVSNFGKVEEIFEKQLEKCGTGYFDFYLLHNVNEINIGKYLDDETYRTTTYLLEQVRNGRIRHLGFSVHGSAEVLERFLERYGDVMEFGMVQLNYVDYHFQDCKTKLELLKRYNIPVWVMEPLRGGMLAGLPEEQHARLEKLRPGVSDVEWAFRYLQSIPEVVTVLTGMTDMEQMKEKIRIYETEAPAKGLEIETIYSIAGEMITKDTIPCTSCRYCLSHCPVELDIPKLLQLYNEQAFTKGGFLAAFGVEALPVEKRPSACIGCRACERVCPQGIKISQHMVKLNESTFGMRKLFFGSN